MCPLQCISCSQSLCPLQSLPSLKASAMATHIICLLTALEENVLTKSHPLHSLSPQNIDWVHWPLWDDHPWPVYWQPLGLPLAPIWEFGWLILSCWYWFRWSPPGASENLSSGQYLFLVSNQNCWLTSWQPTKQQQEFIIAPFLPDQMAMCYMCILISNWHLKFKPDNYTSPWVHINVKKASPQCIFSDVFHPCWTMCTHWGFGDCLTLTYPCKQVYKLLMQAAQIFATS